MSGIVKSALVPRTQLTNNLFSCKSDRLLTAKHNPFAYINMSNIFALNWANIASAVILAVIIAVLSYITSVTDISSISGHQILSIAILTACGSLLQSLLTTQEGTFAGIKVK